MTAMYECMYVWCVLLYMYMCMFTVLKIYVCVPLFSAIGIDEVTLKKNIKVSLVLL